MSRARAFVALCILLGAPLASAADRQADCVPAELKGDAARGAQLHQGCFGCHGLERYTAPVTHYSSTLIDSVLRASGLSDMPAAAPRRFKGRIASLEALRDAVSRRNHYLEPKLNAQEIEDVVAWLNATYYRFPSDKR